MMVMMIGIYLDTQIITYIVEGVITRKKKKNEKTKIRGYTKNLDMIEVGFK